MLVFNEGMPRAGKSYDAVKSHILPALAAGRHVYARLNGLDHAKIAAYLSLPVERVQELLTLVPTADVLETFKAVNGPVAGWSIPAHLKDALFVVDEAHEFYVADRMPIRPELEQFFSLHGQNGMDGVLLSQYYRRLHSSVRCRVERKNVFQKLSAVSMDGSYLVQRYQATAPERFELVEGQTCKYDPAIFPLYSGYAPGAGNVAVYKAGGATVWRRLGKYALFVVPLVLLAGWFLSRFFTGSGGLVSKHSERTAVISRAPASLASAAPGNVMPVVAGGGNRAGALVADIPESEFKAMPDEVAYVFRLCSQARARLAAFGTMGGHEFGVVEWPQGQGAVLDRLSFDQLRAMGVGVKASSFGVRLWYRKTVVIVTAWPLPDAPPSSSDASAVASVPAGAASSAGARGLAWSGPVSVVPQHYVPPGLTDTHWGSGGGAGAKPLR